MKRMKQKALYVGGKKVNMDFKDTRKVKQLYLKKLNGMKSIWYYDMSQSQGLMQILNDRWSEMLESYFNMKQMNIEKKTNCEQWIRPRF